MTTTQQKVIAYLGQFEECVMATVNEKGQPEAATVGFSENQNLELMIGTSRNSRKCRNIFQNPQVAVVVGFKGDITVQFEGIARELTDEELTERKKLYFKKLPELKVFERDPDQVYFSITPNWVRYTDFSQEEKVEELRDFI